MGGVYGTLTQKRSRLNKRPDELKVDVTHLQLGKQIYAGNLSFDKVQIVSPKNTLACRQADVQLLQQQLPRKNSYDIVLVSSCRIGQYRQYAGTRHNIGFMVLMPGSASMPYYEPFLVTEYHSGGTFALPSTYVN